MNPGMYGYPLNLGITQGFSIANLRYQKFTTSGIWYPTGGNYTWFAAMLVAGGGGGGGTGGTSTNSGGGGGGGIISVQGPLPKLPVTITIGAGGNGGNSTTSGATGGSTTLTGGFTARVPGGTGGGSSNTSLWGSSGPGGPNAGGGGQEFGTTILVGLPVFGGYWTSAATDTSVDNTSAVNGSKGFNLYPLFTYDPLIWPIGIGGSTIGGGGSYGNGAAATGSGAANSGGGGGGGSGSNTTGGAGGSGLAHIWWF